MNFNIKKTIQNQDFILIEVCDRYSILVYLCIYGRITHGDDLRKVGKQQRSPNNSLSFPRQSVAMVKVVLKVNVSLQNAKHFYQVHKDSKS